MKRKLILFASALMLLGSGFNAAAGVFDSVFKQFKDKAGAEYVSIPSIAMSAASESQEVAGMNVSGKATGVKVLDMSDCDAVTRDSMIAITNSTARANSKLEKVIQTYEDDEKVTVWIEGDSEKVKAMYVLVIDDEDCTLVELTGKFSRKDIQMSSSSDK